MKQKLLFILGLLFIFISFQLSSQTNNCNIHIIPSDTTIYSSSSVQLQLNTDVQADYYAWKPNNNITDTTLRNPIVTLLPNSSNQYILQAMFTDSVNLVTNGNFEQGNTGFTSNYSLGTSPLQEGEYGISNYGPNLHQNFSPCSHDGNFMAGNAYTSPNKIFFQSNTITIQPNTNYLFSIDYTEIDSNTTRPLNQLAIFKFTINDVQINSNDTVVNSPCVWKTYSKVWNSGNNTTATIKVYDVNIIQWANDFAIDNISLKKLCMAYDTININVTNNHNTYRDTIRLGACEGSFPISFRDSSYNDTGTYTYTVSTQEYDSIYTLIISKYLSFNDTISATICSNEVYNMNGFNENTTGFYTHNFTSINGCDSIVNLSLTVNLTDDTIIYDTIYRGDVYSRYGFNVVDSGTYSHYYQLHSGCKSLVTLYLNVIERPHIDVWLPNCFTPSSNNNNTFGYYTDLTNFILTSFEIYNRWGEKIFYSTKKGEFWDGRYKGKDCDQNTFVWRLLYKTTFSGDCQYEKVGTVLLLR